MKKIILVFLLVFANVLFSLEPVSWVIIHPVVLGEKLSTGKFFKPEYGNRLLLVGQLDPIENGIYVYLPGQWPRSPDAADGMYFPPDAIQVLWGVFSDTYWELSNIHPSVIGLDKLYFHRNLNYEL